jgi:hypothetical protein
MSESFYPLNPALKRRSGFGPARREVDLAEMLDPWRR